MKISIDTRTLRPGDTFIPIKGPNFDGHDFIQEALNKGASRVLDVDLLTFAKQYRKRLNCRVIGITGSYGKTTTKDLLYSVLSQKFNVVKTNQNENNEIGVPLTMLKADAETDIIIVEMGMRQSGDLLQLSKIVRPTHVVLTGIGVSHLEQFKDQRDIARAKSEVFLEALKWEKADRIAYINQKTDYFDLANKRARSKGYKVMPYSGETGHDQSINLMYMIGQHFEISEVEIQIGLNTFAPSAHRLQVYRMSDVTLIDDTYNANPHGMRFAFQRLKQFSGRRIVVLGDMLELGKDGIKYHQALAPDLIDAGVSIVFTFGTLMKALYSENLDISHFDTHLLLIQALKNELKKGDVVLFKGSRGMNLEDIVEEIRGTYA